ncbi:hypothetical protein Tco_1227396 [Tanacetum coccineum]
MIYKKNVDYGELIWEDFQYQINSRQTSAKRREHMPYPKFTKVIINYFLSKHSLLPKRHSSFINAIKYDSILGKLKFVNKGEEHQKYGMSIPDAMMNDEIRSSVPYLYLALSTNTEVDIPKVGKGRGKGVTGNKKDETIVPKEKKKATTRRKKSSITVDDNILPDPDEALKLESEETEYDEVQPLIQRIQQHSKGSSEGSGIIPEVPDEPKNIFGSLSNSLSGSNDEIEDISSDEENKAEHGNDIEKQVGEEEPKSGSFQEHEKHLDLYNALIGSIGLDEAITKGELDLTQVLKKRRHDDKDQDPVTDSAKEKKRRKRKDSEPSKDKA